MTKDDAIKLLGGTPSKAAEALGYSSVHAVYMWPDELPMATSDRVRGAVARLKLARKNNSKQKPAQPLASQAQAATQSEVA